MSKKLRKNPRQVIVTFRDCGTKEIFTSVKKALDYIGGMECMLEYVYFSLNNTDDNKYKDANVIIERMYVNPVRP